MLRTLSPTTAAALRTRVSAAASRPAVLPARLASVRGHASHAHAHTHTHTPATGAARFTLPKTQTAAIVRGSGAPLEVINDYPVTQAADLKPGECIIRLHCTGVCHTDLHAKNGDWPDPAKTPLIGGHEGVGEVVAIGTHTVNSPVKLGDRVGIKWLAYSCLDCEPCRKGFEQNCEKALYSGFTTDGTFSEYVVSYVQHVTPIPENLDSNTAASILCAGVTTYRAIKYSNASIGQWIVIPGAGGGLGHLAIQYAVAMGLRVIAVDTGAEKKALSLSLGAEKWVDFKESKDIVADIKAASGGAGAHAALVTASSPAAYQQAIDYLRPTGTLVAVGLPGKGSIDASIYRTVTKSINIVGSYVGNRQDAREALEIASRGKVKCHYVLKDLPDLPEVFDGMDKGQIAGRVVLNMEQ